MDYDFKKILDINSEKYKHEKWDATILDIFYIDRITNRLVIKNVSTKKTYCSKYSFSITYSGRRLYFDQNIVLSIFPMKENSLKIIKIPWFFIWNKKSIRNLVSFQKMTPNMFLSDCLNCITFCVLFRFLFTFQLDFRFKQLKLRLNMFLLFSPVCRKSRF